MANSAGFVADLHAQYADAVSSFSRDGERTVAILEGLLPVARGNGEEELVANGWVLLARCLVDLGLPARAHRELDALQNWLVLHPRWLAQLAESHDFRAQIYLAGNQLAEAEAQWLHCLDYALARQAVTLYFAASLGLGDVARLEGSVEEG